MKRLFARIARLLRRHKTHSIVCAWCGLPIMIDEPITLYGPKDRNDTPLEGAVKYQDDLLIYVGCLRSNCADTGGDRAGFWRWPGQVERVASPIELALATGGMVISEDLSKNADAVILPDIE